MWYRLQFDPILATTRRSDSASAKNVFPQTEITQPETLVKQRRRHFCKIIPQEARTRRKKTSKPENFLDRHFAN